MTCVLYLVTVARDQEVGQAQIDATILHQFGDLHPEREDDVATAGRGCQRLFLSRGGRLAGPGRKLPSYRNDRIGQMRLVGK